MWYFGLSYVDSDGMPTWLSLDKKVPLFLCEFINMQKEIVFVAWFRYATKVIRGFYIMYVVSLPYFSSY